MTTIKPRKIATLGLLTAIALTIFMVEAQIPSILPLPGVKLGLANIVTVFTVFALSPRDGILGLVHRHHGGKPCQPRHPLEV